MTQGDGMDEQGRDGIDEITAANVSEWSSKVPDGDVEEVPWVTILHDVNKHDVHISKYAHVCLCKREKRENV